MMSASGSGVECRAQCAGGIGMRVGSLRDGAAHFDELVDNAPVNFQIYRHTRHAQAVGILHPLVYQGVAFGKPYPCGRCAGKIGFQSVRAHAVQRGKAPVIPVSWCAYVVIEKVSDIGLVENKAFGIAAV